MSDARRRRRRRADQPRATKAILPCNHAWYNGR